MQLQIHIFFPLLSYRNVKGDSMNLRNLVNMRIYYVITAVFISVILMIAGCDNSENPGLRKWYPDKSWQANAGWKAEDYFTDPKTIALCKSIEKKDIPAVNKLIAEGANVKDIGKGNMTPLLWSFSSGEEFFKILLEHGADPNVVITEDFGLPMVLSPGISVMYLASSTQFPNYCKLCLKHGGDPNLPHTGFYHNTPINAAILANRIDNVKLLIEHGADVNYCDLKNGSLPPVLFAPGFDCKLILLEAGASYSQRGGDILEDGRRSYGNYTVIYELAEQYDNYYQDQRISGQDYKKVLNWFYTKGIDVKKAIPYVKKWKEYHQFTDAMNDEELDRWQREAYAVDTKQRGVLPSGPLYQVRTKFLHEPIQQKMYLIGITEKDVRIMGADGTFRTLNRNLCRMDTYYFDTIFKNLVDRYTKTVQINYFKQNSNPFEWNEEKLKDITVHEPLYFFYNEHGFVSCLYATSSEDKIKFHFPANPNEQPKDNVVDLLDEREINTFLPHDENSENQEEKNKVPPRREGPPRLKTVPEGMFYPAGFRNLLCRYGDRKAEKKIIPVGTPVTWSVTVDNDSESNVSKTDFQPVALQSDRLKSPNRYRRDRERLLFVDEFKNNVIYSSHYSKDRIYTTFVELHNFDSGKHQVFELPIATSVEDLIPEKNTLLGRHSNFPDKTYSNIVTLLRKNTEGQFDTYLQFAPYYQKISSNQKNFNETDNDLVAVRAVNSTYIITFAKKRLTLWDIDRVQSVYSIECHSSASVLSRNKKWLAVPFGIDGRYTTGIEIRDALTGQCCGVLPGCFSVIQKTSFSPSGKQLAALYDNTLTIYSLETGQKSIEVPCRITFRPADLCWLGETMILVNDVLYDLQRQVPLCQLQSLDIKRLPVNQGHGGRLWTVIRNEEKYTLVNIKLPQQNMEETFNKTDPKNMYDYYPEVPLKLVAAIEGAEDNVLNNITKEYRQRLEKKGIKFSDDAKLQLRLTFRTATQKERSAFFGSVDPKTKDDYFVPEVKICDENVSFWLSPAIVYHKSNWKVAIKKAEQSNESGGQENEFMQNIFCQPIPRYLMKPQSDFPWTVMKATFDK